MQEKCLKILEEISNAVSQIAFFQGKRDGLIEQAVPFLAEFQVGDTLVRKTHNRGGTTEYGRVVGRSGWWDKELRQVRVIYEIRKITKSGELHSLVNKINDVHMQGWGFSKDGSERQEPAGFGEEGAGKTRPSAG